MGVCLLLTHTLTHEVVPFRVLQVAVHNVPFKWCNADLEALFRTLPGYLDAQLLCHKNGRSKVRTEFSCIVYPP
jgi:antibiotic biosynthesis monooxygenase (ABM) superfamily enzyme